MNIFTVSLPRRWVCSEVSCIYKVTASRLQGDNFEKSRDRLPMGKKQQCSISISLSIFYLRYNEVNCNSLKLYPFLSSKQSGQLSLS